MNRRKGQLAGVALMVIGMGLMMWFAAQDAHVLDDGTLVEPFATFGVGIGVFLTGTAIYLLDWLVASLKQKRSR